MKTIKQNREVYAMIIGNDGTKLLTPIYADPAPAWLRELSKLQTLQQVGMKNFYWEEGDLRWRTLSPCS